jgi:sugar phosphate permease
MIKRLPFHYAWVVVVVTFVTALFAAGVRNIAGVILKPLETDLNWDASQVSFAVAVSLIAFGLGAPVSGWLIDRFGPKRIMIGGMGLTAFGLWLMTSMTELWQLHLLWGLIVGVGTSCIAGVLGATVTNRWFNAYRGIVLGLMSAAAAAGQLIFLPTLVSLTTNEGWRSMLTVVAIGAGALIVPILLIMRDRPNDVGLEPVGGEMSAAQSSSVENTKKTSIREAIRTKDFWLLAGSFFVCGYTTNGLIGTHLLAHTVDHGFIEMQTAGAVALMGVMNIVGTLISGWLSDRYDNRKLLATYYGLRALSLVALPYIVEMNGLYLFAVIYGLDWVATVPPTINLTSRTFGRASLGTIYGWIFCSHMIGAALAAQVGGSVKVLTGNYTIAFLSAAVLGFIAAGLSSQIGNRVRKPTLAMGEAPLA